MSEYEVTLVATFGAHTENPKQTRGVEKVKAKDPEEAKRIARIRFEEALQANSIPPEDVPLKITKVVLYD